MCCSLVGALWHPSRIRARLEGCAFAGPDGMPASTAAAAPEDETNSLRFIVRPSLFLFLELFKLLAVGLVQFRIPPVNRLAVQQQVALKLFLFVLRHGALQHL